MPTQLTADFQCPFPLLELLIFIPLKTIAKNLNFYNSLTSSFSSLIVARSRLIIFFVVSSAFQQSCENVLRKEKKTNFELYFNNDDSRRILSTFALHRYTHRPESTKILWHFSRFDWDTIWNYKSIGKGHMIGDWVALDSMSSQQVYPHITLPSLDSDSDNDFSIQSENRDIVQGEGGFGGSHRVSLLAGCSQSLNSNFDLIWHSLCFQHFHFRFDWEGESR